jgi:hypothetical protein
MERTLAGGPGEMPALARLNPLPGDGTVLLREAAHSYHRGPIETASRSVTALAAAQFEKFDAQECFNNYFVNWKHDASSRYFNRIKEVHDKGGDDSAAMKAIREDWSTKARESSQAGQRAHLAIELVSNGLEPPDCPELRLWRSWWEKRDLEFYRSELVTWVETASNKLLLAGSVDCLARDAEGRYILVDWKRSDRDLTRNALPFQGKKGKGRCSHLPDTGAPRAHATPPAPLARLATRNPAQISTGTRCSCRCTQQCLRKRRASTSVTECTL